MKNFIFLLLVSLLVNCNKKQNPSQEIISIQDSEEVENMLLESPPNPNSTFVSVYVLNINDTNVYETNFSNLKHLYELRYKQSFKTFNYFLYEIVNQKFKLKISDAKKDALFLKSFQLDNKIWNLYKKGGIGGIINNYCVFEKKRYFLSSKDLTLREQQTISYCFFINGYVKIVNDYSNTNSYLKCKSLMHYPTVGSIPKNK